MTTQNSRTKLSSFSTKLLSSTALTAASLAALVIPANAQAQSIPDNALPSGEVVTHGSADYDRSTDNVLKITQNSGTVSADYFGGFNIGKDAAVLMVQKSSDKFVHIDKSDKVSIINGLFSGNGTNFILNRDGILIGENAVIDMGGFVASTGELGAGTDLDAGKIELNNFGSGAIDIKGGATISVADAGIAAFVSPTIRNAGVINAKLGKVAFAAGEKVTLDLYGDNLVEIAVSDKLADAIIEHTGAINAEGGVVQMTAQAAKEAVDNIINVKGVVTVASATQQGGKIILSGGEQGTVNVEGTLDASGTNGGSIDVKGENVTIASSAKLNADGGTGADQSGNGGLVNIIADQRVNFDGIVKARGGDIAGNGGNAEVSGKEFVFGGDVDLTAANGFWGTLLLDPSFIIIHDGVLNLPVFASAQNTNILSQDRLANALKSANVTLNATDFIDVGLADSYGSSIADVLTNLGVDIGLLGDGDIDLSTWQGLFSHGTTGGSLKLDSDTVNFNTDLTMGNGGVTVDAATVNLDGTIRNKTGAVIGDSKLSGNAGTVNVVSNDALINQGVSLAGAGATVNVGKGLYTEQVNIGKNLSLIGAGKGETTIKAPEVLGNTFGANGSRAIVYVHGADDVTIDGFTIDGAENGDSNAGANFVGIGFYNAGGDITNTDIKNIKFPGNSGAQSGYGILGLSDDGHAHTLDVTGADVSNVQKNGIVFWGAGQDGTISGSTITGSGDIDYIAQNGIVIRDGANAIIGGDTDEDGNTISGFGYGPSAWTASSILLYSAGNSTDVKHNTITGTGLDVGIYAYDTDTATIEANTIDGSANGIDVVDSDGATVSGNTILNSVYDGIYAEGGVGLTIDGANEVTSSGDDGIDIVDVTGTVSIKDNMIDGTTGGHESNGIAISGTDGVTIDHNTVKNTDWNNINVANAKGTQIINNTLTDSESASGIGIWQGSDETLIDANTISGSNTGIWNQGGTLEISRNTISADQNGIYLLDTVGTDIHNNFINDAANAGIYADGSPAGVTAFDNSFTGNAKNIINATANMVQASFNWWGSNDETVVAGKITGSVDISPYQNTGIDTDTDEAGYQGDMGDLQVTGLGAQTTGLIQEAIDNADEGGEVQVNAGTYTEDLLIDKAGLKLTGKDGAILQSAGGANLITIAADDVKIDPFVFDGLGADYGVYSNGWDSLVVDGNTFLNFAIDAIHVEDADNVQITGNTIDSVGANGIFAKGITNSAITGNFIGTTGGANNIGQAGIVVENGTNVDIGGTTLAKGNTIQNVAAGWGHKGIGIKSGSDILVGYNQLSDIGGYGLYAEGSYGAPVTTLDILNNSLTNSEFGGIYLKHWNGADIETNTVTGTANGNGIALELTTGTDVFGNTVSGAAEAGVKLEYGNDETDIQGNTLTNNKYGVHLGNAGGQYNSNTLIGFENAEDPDAMANRITGGQKGVFVEGGSNLRVAGNYVSGTSDAGIDIANSGGAYNTVYFNKINDTKDGIRISGTTSTIADNRIGLVTGLSGYGIIVSNSDSAEILGNKVSNAALDGIKVSGGNLVKVKDGNEVRNIGRVGIYAANATNLLIDGNTVDNTTFAIGSPYGGITTDWGSNITISGNKVSNSGHGVMMYSAGGTNTISGNQINSVTNNGVNANQVAGLTISGNRIGYGADGVLGNDDTTIGVDGIYVNASNGATVSGNKITNAGDDGIEIVGSNNVTVGGASLAQGNIVNRSGHDSITTEGGDNVDVTFNTVTDTLGASAVAIHGTTNSTVQGNILTNTALLGIYGQNSHGIQILDNVIANVGYNAPADHPHSTGIGVESADGVTVTGNKLDGVKGNAISVGRAINNGSGASTGVTVSNNVIGYGADGVLSADDTAIGGNGILIVDAPYSTVSGNKVTNTALNGIHVDPSPFSKINNNTVSDFGLNSSGILLEEGDDSEILGNTVTGNNGANQSGIKVTGSDRVQIGEGQGGGSNRNTVSKVGTGIALQGGSDITVDNNSVSLVNTGIDANGVLGTVTITDNALDAGAGRNTGANGINIVNAANVVIGGAGDRNTIDDFTTGIVVSNVTTELDIHNNDLTNGQNPGATGVGISVTGSNNVEVGDGSPSSASNVVDGYQTGIYVSGGSNVEVDGNKITDSNYGIDATGVTTLRVFDNVLDGRTGSGQGNTGIRVNGGSGVQVGANNDGNFVDDFDTGIQIIGSDDAQVAYNEINRNGSDTTNSVAGIVIDGGNSVDVDFNKVDDAATGIRLNGTSDADVDDNTVSDASTTGIFVNGASNADVRRNKISNAGNGITVTSSANTLNLLGNTIGADDHGILFTDAISGSDAINVHDNTIVANEDRDLVGAGIWFDGTINGGTVTIGDGSGAPLNNNPSNKITVLTSNVGGDTNNLDGIHFDKTIGANGKIIVDGNRIGYASNLSQNAVADDGIEFRGGVNGNADVKITDNWVASRKDGIQFNGSVAGDAKVLIGGSGDGNTIDATTGDTLGHGIVFTSAVGGNALLTVSANDIEADQDGINFSGAVSNGNNAATNDVIITDNDIWGRDNGVNFAFTVSGNNHDTLISGNDITGLGGDGVHFGGTVDNADIRIVSNTSITGGDDGVNFSGLALNGALVEINDNTTIVAGDDGVSFDNVITNSVLKINGNDNIDAGDDGINLAGGLNASTLEIIDNNHGIHADDHGIYVGGTVAGSTVTINDNIITANEDRDGVGSGIWFDGAVTGSTVTIGNGDGSNVDANGSNVISVRSNNGGSNANLDGIHFGGAIGSGTDLKIDGNRIGYYASVHNGATSEYNSYDRRIAGEGIQFASTVDGNADIDITDNFIRSGADGVNFTGAVSGTATILIGGSGDKNTIDANGDGVEFAANLGGQAQVEISNNTVTATGDGLKFNTVNNADTSFPYSERELLIASNTITGGQNGINFTGLVSGFGHDTLITGNTIDGLNEDGIRFGNAIDDAEVRIVANTDINGDNDGIHVEGSVRNNALVQIADNTRIEGEDDDAIDFVSDIITGGVVSITGNHAIVADDTADNGIEFAGVNAAKVEILNNNAGITADNHGIYFGGAINGGADLDINDNIIYADADNNGSGNGIHFNGAIGTSTITIGNGSGSNLGTDASNIISGEDGIHFASTVSGNANIDIDGNRLGYTANKLSGPIFSNRLDDNGIVFAGAVSGNADIDITDNFIRADEQGILFSSTVSGNANVLIGGNGDGNTIDANQDGIEFNGSISGTSQITVSYNTVDADGNGLVFRGDTSNADTSFPYSESEILISHNDIEGGLNGIAFYNDASGFRHDIMIRDNDNITGHNGDGILFEDDIDAASLRILNNGPVYGSRDGIHIEGRFSNDALIDISGNWDIDSGSGDGIEVTDTGLTWGADLNITGNHVHYTGDNGIEVNNVDGAYIAGNTVHDADANGIAVSNSDDAEIRHNNVDDSGEHGILVDGSDDADVVDNDVSDSEWDGIHASNSDDISIRWNDVTRSGDDGINLVNSDDAEINYNDIFRTGLSSWNGNGIEVEGNFWNDNTDIIGNDITFAGADGIEVSDSAYSDIRGNDIRYSGDDGIDVDGSAFVDVVNNHVHGAAQNGIEVTDSFAADITLNRVHYTGRDGIFADNIGFGDVRNNTVHDTGDDGIDVRNSFYVDVNGNTVYDTNGDGIQIRSSEHADVNGNTVHDTGDDGIDVEQSAYVTVDSNTVTSTTANGIEVQGSDFAHIGGNTVNYAGHNGIYVNPSSVVTIIGNFVNFAGWDGIQVNGGSSNTASGNTVLGSGWNGIAFNGSDSFKIVDNTTNNNGLDGILVFESDRGFVNNNTSNLNNGNGISIQGSDTVDVNNNTVLNNDVGLHIRDSKNIGVWGNGFGFNSLYGVFAEGPDNGTILLANNVINASPVGARFESGVIDITGLSNVIVGTGGTVGLQFDEVGTPGSLSLAGNTIGATIFTGFLPVGSYYVRFEDGALLDPATGEPIVIDGLNANFDGLIPASQGGFLTQAQLDFLEGRIFDADDAFLNGRGQLFVGRVPTEADLGLGLENLEDFFNRYGTPDDGVSGFSVTVRGLPNVTAAGLNALTPAAGTQGPAGLNAITPAAGDEADAAPAAAPQDIEPAAGGEDVSCWSDAVSANGSATFNFGGSFEDSLAGAGKCGSGSI
jgi:parallel beta-helix repeat protein